MAERPQQPYLLRAMHEWMTDSGLTPHIVVDAEADGVEVPTQFVRDGRIILNVSYSATDDLILGNDEISFAARFAGTPHRVCVPTPTVLGIYARETGQGLVFSDADASSANTDQPTPVDDGNDAKPETRGRPNLRVVK